MVPYVILGYPTEYLAGGGYFYHISNLILQNGFSYPYHITLYGGIRPFAYNPLVFYLVSATDILSPFSLMFLHNNLQPLLSITTILLFYLFVRELFSDTNHILLSTFLYAVSVRSFSSFLFGHGIVEAVGTVIFLIYLYFIYKAYNQESNRYLIIGGIMFGVAGLTLHGAALGASLVLFSLTLKKLIDTDYYFAIKSLIITIILGITVSSPWWLTVLSRHGPATFLYAFSSRSGVINVLDNITKLNPFYSRSILAGFVIIGLIYLLSRKQHLLPILFLLFIPWGEIGYLKPIVSIPLVPVAVFDVIIPTISDEDSPVHRSIGDINIQSINMKQLSTLLVIGLIIVHPLAAGFGYYIAEGDINSAIEIKQGSEEVRNAANWARSNTCKNSTFIATRNSNIHFGWFPVLSNRTVINHYFGSEWTGEFDKCHTMTNDITGSSSSYQLRQTIREYNISPDYIAIGNKNKTSQLIDSLKKDEEYKLEYNNSRVYIFDINMYQAC